MTKSTGDVIKDLEMGDYPGGPNVITSVPVEEAK